MKGATTVMGRLVASFGESYAGEDPRLSRLMPTAQRLAACSTGDIASLGMPGARADAVLALARAVASGAFDLAPGGDPVLAMRALTALPGIGDWTAQYIAMRALRWPDAFPANDLVLRRAAGNLSAAALRARAEAWRPWRAYAAMHLWRSAALVSLLRRLPPTNSMTHHPTFYTTIDSPLGRVAADGGRPPSDGAVHDPAYPRSGA